MGKALQQHTDTEDLISELIDLKQEGDYWDFKKCFSDNTDLIHDIICMANNLAGRDGYIIFGVAEDNANNYVAVGVEETKRKNQADIITLLKDCKFAGDIRPEIRLETIIYGGHEIDVLTVKNTSQTPYFLTETKNGKNVSGKTNDVFKYHIYTRIGDTNTSKNMSADLDKIEILWKKRFFLDKTPLERLMNHIQYSEWDSECENMGERDKYFCKVAPEFTVEIVSTDESERFDNPRYTYYSVLFCKIGLGIAEVSISYYGTVLKALKAYWLDESRYLITDPKLATFNFRDNTQNNFSYRYYIKNELSYLLLRFFDRIREHESNYLGMISEVFLIFDTESEQKLFHAYLCKNEVIFKKNYEKQDTPFIDEHSFSPGRNLETTIPDFQKQIKTGRVLNQMFVEFKSTY